MTFKLKEERVHLLQGFWFPYRAIGPSNCLIVGHSTRHY